MYTQFFGLRQPPFSSAPDPRYFFMSEGHREAMAHLLYGVGHGGGFVLLTGEIGAGKTTVCRGFLQQIPAHCDVAYIFNPKLTVNELLQSICDEFRIKLKDGGQAAATVKDYVDALNHHLLATHAAGRNEVLIIDEAQNLSSEVLEQLRLLTNLETNERKLLQIILIGQPELRTLLARPELEPLAQRVIARYHLDSLSAQETADYILHRLAVAGLTTAPPIRRQLMRQIHRLTNGVPRRINLLCDRALLGAYAESKPEVDRVMISKAASEAFGGQEVAAAVRARLWRQAALGLAAGALIVGTAAWTLRAGRRLEAASLAPASVSKTLPPETLAATAAKPAPEIILTELEGAFGAKLRDEAEAYWHLALLWGLALPEGAPCEVSPEEGLRCYKSNLGLAGIRQLDRPVVLTLRDDAGKIYYALLTGLTDASATLRIGTETRTVNLVALARRFQGEFATFLRLPRSYPQSVGAGASGEAVDWIATQLAKLDGSEATAANQSFDQGLVKKLREFQSAQGLEADGIVGPKTYMHLNSVAGVAEPRLKMGS